MKRTAKWLHACWLALVAWIGRVFRFGRNGGKAAEIAMGAEAAKKIDPPEREFPEADKVPEDNNEEYALGEADEIRRPGSGGAEAGEQGVDREDAPEADNECMAEAGGDVVGAETGTDPRLVLEALLFQSDEPLEERDIQAHLGTSVAILPLLESLQEDYSKRGIRLERSERRWAFRTAPEVAPLMTRREERPKRLSRAALETLAIIAYQQPVTRAEIEAVRGVPVSSGTLDLLVDAGWVAPRGRKEAPGRPVMWGTTPDFLDHFALAALEDLPRLDELEGAGLFKPLHGDSG